MADFLKDQIITYIGNKRLLLGEIQALLHYIKEKEGKEEFFCGDLFAGSGIVARLLKGHASWLVVNDLEHYSRVINSCYLSNRSDFDEEAYDRYRIELENLPKVPGLISAHYAPGDDDEILPGERAFYTRENALRIDTYRRGIDDLPQEMKKYFLAPLLYGASVHVNTGGVFKGFYKDRRTGVGKFGGTGENALQRIKGRITLQKPVLSERECPVEIYRRDASELAEALPPMDLVYLDPPYNQHPYGSNYFMLNVIAENRLEGKISPVSGIPAGWNRSAYNKKNQAKDVLSDLIRKLKCKYIILSYNSEGFISYEEILDMLGDAGRVIPREMKYNTYRGSRNLENRSIYVNEYLFLLEKE
ncbi:MAG: DNA adenine methylase [Anaerovoracaceae bacterium]|jgi:adenine-specific DNA-methyltransferase